MANQAPQTSTAQQKTVPPAKKPNEHGSIAVMAYFKIYDPATKRVYVEGRS